MNNDYPIKQYVTYEIAKKLNELGFNEPCIGYATKEYPNIIHTGISFKIHKESDLPTKPFSVPLWQQAEEWLFKQYNIFIEIKRLKVTTDPDDDLYVYYCEIDFKTGVFSSQHYKTPNQALRKGIEEALIKL